MNVDPCPKPKRRFLIVEDEFLIAAMLQNVLGDIGHHVVATARHPSAALQALKTHHIDAAILDLNVGGQSSQVVADELAARGIPFIFVTGYERSVIDGRHRDRPLLGKPFHMNDLIKALAELL